ncbi:aldehyde dehydrogenase family protein [Saccharopolyspora sp. WRP15-2]|uniref:Aldehyde dehydrogenase family protein n=1 Tax=Saccharopolyspora oryzae TaxID=2997343 RepID=A0ABT4V9J7_9PSEU|nr:aldehyde dehydrogenase family protein [Saccharopolyspora oryzae]MDA3630637.1 aldehyde dehydrogenase family protein [Saccharopolyspora oryzae]
MSVHEVLERTESANFVENRWTPSQGDQVASANPADPHDDLPATANSTPADIDAAVAAAKDAASDWAATPAPVRGDILRRWNELIGQHVDELAELMTREMGKPLAESKGELARARLELDYAAGEAARLHGTTIPSRAEGQLVYTVREPLGVVAAITPWNFPAVAPIRKLGPALASGCTVVLKPALETPLTALALAAMARDAGLPAGVLNVVCGRGSLAGAHLASHPDVAGVSFTGSTAVGRQISESVARKLGVVQLELGGKNAAYIHSAKDLGKVVNQITSAAAQTSGQRCTAISRVIVQDELADELVRLLTDKYAALTVGPGLDPSTQIGPLVNHAQHERVDRYVRKGLEEGAVRTTPDRPVPEGPYFVPTVLDHVTPEMVVAREEIFGPVLAVLRVSDVDEAIAVANDSDYGLASVVFSEHLDVAMRFTNAVQAGMVHVNHGTISQPHVPFGGVGESGVGDYSIGHTTTAFFTQLKVVYMSPAIP